MKEKNYNVVVGKSQAFHEIIEFIERKIKKLESFRSNTADAEMKKVAGNKITVLIEIQEGAEDYINMLGPVECRGAMV